MATVSHFSFSSMSIDRTVVRSAPDPWVPGCKILDVIATGPLAPNPSFTAGLSLNQIARGKTMDNVLAARSSSDVWQLSTG